MPQAPHPRALKADAPVLGKRDCDLEVSHDLTSSESKLKLSTVLGSGLTAIGSLTSKGSASKLAYEVEYDTTLGEGRTLSATVSPADGMPTHRATPVPHSPLPLRRPFAPSPPSSLGPCAITLLTLHPPPPTMPPTGTGEIEYEDSATVDATITATFPLGGSPKVQVSRKFGF